MCYSVAFIERKSEQYAERYREILPPELSIESNIPQLPLFYFVSGFDHPKLPIVKYDGIFLFEWGLIPPWVEHFESAKEIRTKTLNAVGETAFNKPSFQHAMVSQRCLLGVNGFYEWRHLNKMKYPYFIKAESNSMFSLGCIYESWIDTRTGEPNNTFSILTTPANKLMEKIHNVKKRMPLIISKRDEKRWIEPQLTREEIMGLVKPNIELELVAYPVSPQLNHTRNDRNHPESMVEQQCPPFNQPQLF